MIEDPPLLTIKPRTLSVDPSVLTELAGFATGVVVDAMNGRGALPHSLQALSSDILPLRCCGQILTVDPGPADVLAVLASMTEIEPGDVLVIATGGHDRCASLGDRVAGMARNAGATGIVTDGLVRDVEGIEKVGLPVYCKGVSPNSPYNNGPGFIGSTVTIGDVTITRNDILLADTDGAVVVPGEQVEKVIDRCRQIATLEAELDAEVENGLIAPEAIRELLSGDRVCRLEKN